MIFGLGTRRGWAAGVPWIGRVWAKFGRLSPETQTLKPSTLDLNCGSGKPSEKVPLQT